MMASMMALLNPARSPSFPVPKDEPPVLRMPPGIAIGERSEQQSSGMRGHVQAVGDEGKGAENGAADNLGNHHQATQPDNGPGPARVSIMPAAEEHVAVSVWNWCGHVAVHDKSLLEIAVHDFDQL